MKRIFVALAVMLSMAVPAMAIDFTFNGDFNHRFRMYTNQAGFFDGGDKGERLTRTALVKKDTNNDTMGELKYRLWTTAASDDGAIKGVFAIELGGIQFGSGTDGDFSGDGRTIEARWAYTDFALAGGRARIGLMPIKVNKFLWNETVTGVDYKVAAGAGDLTVAWFRGYEVTDTDNSPADLDAFYLRYDLKPAEGIKVGFFGLWQTSDGLTLNDSDKLEAAADREGVALDTAQATFDALGSPDANDYIALQEAKAAFTSATDAVPSDPTHYYTKGFTSWDLDLYTLGVDGNMKAGNLFANWDLMYQTGDFMEDQDFGGYFAHFDVGVKLGKGKLTYTFWYASGDDDSNDGDMDAFIATDIDINSEYSVILFEGYTDDDYFSSSPYLQDKGLILNRIGYDYQVTDKLKVGAAALYLMTAEDIGNDTDNDGKVDQYEDDTLGVEFDAYASYKLFTNTEAAIQFGYLMADDAMDYYEFEQDGDADEDIFIISSRIRYKF